MCSFKYIRSFIVGLLLSCIYHSQALADNPQGTCGENCTWEIVDGTLKISGTGNMDNYSNWGSDQPWASYKNSITKISVGEGITSIGSQAFHSLSNASEITLPSTLKSISSYAFRQGNIKSIEIPESVENIAYGAFASNEMDVIIVPTSKLELSAIFGGISSTYTGKDSRILCRGNQSECQRITQSVLDWSTAHPQLSGPWAGGLLTLAPYEKYDKDGNPIEIWSNEGGLIYDKAGNVITKFGADGNQIGSYTYDAGGNLIKAIENGNVIYRRRIYTPSEATVAVQNNKNTFSIIYR